MHNHNTTIYLSDFFTVPMPQKAISHRHYLQKIKRRRILWALLPYLVEAVGILTLIFLMVAGMIVCTIGLGG